MIFAHDGSITLGGLIWVAVAFFSLVIVLSLIIVARFVEKSDESRLSNEEFQSREQGSLMTQIVIGIGILILLYLFL